MPTNHDFVHMLGAKLVFLRGVSHALGYYNAYDAVCSIL